MTLSARVLGAALVGLACAVNADIKSEVVDYRDGEVALQGRIYNDASVTGRKPGIIVVHEWWGLNDHAKQRAQQLAELGYVAFAVDMYGKDKVTQHPDQAQAWMSEITSNVDAWQRRALIALDLLREHPAVASDKLAAIGYCFGGATVMQMAYAGADLAGVASFHGSLPPAAPEQARRIKAAVYVAHGDADAFVPQERVAAFKSALADAQVDLQFTAFPGVKHSFTNPAAASYGIENVQYDAEADATSWRELQDFFARIFAP